MNDRTAHNQACREKTELLWWQRCHPSGLRSSCNGEKGAKFRHFRKNEDGKLVPADREYAESLNGLCDELKPYWQWVKRIITLFLFLQTFAFVSFMFEESLQTTGFAIKASLDAGDIDAAMTARDTYQNILWKAQSWQHSAGRLAFLSYRGYATYFDMAAEGYLIANTIAIKTAMPKRVQIIIGKRALSEGFGDYCPSVKAHCIEIGRNIVQGWLLTKKGEKPVNFPVFGGKVPINVLGWELRGRAWLSGRDPYEAFPPGSVPGDDFN